VNRECRNGCWEWIGATCGGRPGRIRAILWRANNRDKFNARQREVRAIKKAEAMNA